VNQKVTGRLSRHRDGYGFVIPDTPLKRINGDIFIPAQFMSDAMHGDRVEVRIGRIGEDGRADGRIERITRRAHSEVVGRFRRGKSYSFVIPEDRRVGDEILIPRKDELPAVNTSRQRTGDVRFSAAGSKAGVRLDGAGDLDGAIVNVEITRFPNSTQKARGRVIEVLGRPGDFGIDVEIIIRKHHLPHRFSEEVLAEAAAAPTEVILEPSDFAPIDLPPSGVDLQGRPQDARTWRSAPLLAPQLRRDFRDLPIVTIDGETARDFDDAVYVERNAAGNYLLQVHVADVSHYVRPRTELDLEARLRGTSVYFPDRAVPMLPVELSTGICSLNPHVDRLVMSCLMEMDHQGAILNYEITPGVIRSVERMTYTNVNLVLANDPAQCERYAPLVERFQLMEELARTLIRKRRKRGSIDFDLPEPEIEFDEMGKMVSIVRSERNIAHRIIEEFMLSANETVAGHFEHNQIPALYRIHEMPNPARIIEFEEIAASFGYSLGIGALPVHRLTAPLSKQERRRGKDKGFVMELPGDVQVSPRNYQKLAEQIAGTPVERILSFLMLRSLKQARYSEENRGHFGLAAPVYTHFTSPIRRYPDLIVHRVLKGMLRNPAELPGIASESSEAERRAQDAERELMEWKKVAFMSERVGEVFDALIVSVVRFGFFVELTDLFVEGLVHLDTLDQLMNDRHFFRDGTREIVAERSKKRYKIGGRLRVRVDRVDPVERKINFAVEPEG
jgi:ribonuclease R